MNRRLRIGSIAWAFVTVVAFGARAQDADRAPSGAATSSLPLSDARNQTPRLAFTDPGFGLSAASIGVAGFATARGAADRSAQQPQATGGFELFGSPLQRLTLVGIAERVFDGPWRPTATALVRVLGGREQGWALGALARYKADGFAEIEGEIELGAMLALARGGWHLDINAIVGTGLEESEADAEGKLRFGFDLSEWMRVGLDGQLRYRLTGERLLAGGRSWDAIVGPQLLGAYKNLYGALTAGPSTVDIVSKVGWSTILTAGGVTL